MRITKNDTLFNQLVNYHNLGGKLYKSKYSIILSDWKDSLIEGNKTRGLIKLTPEEIRVYKKQINTLIQKYGNPSKYKSSFVEIMDAISVLTDMGIILGTDHGW